MTQDCMLVDVRAPLDGLVFAPAAGDHAACFLGVQLRSGIGWLLFVV